MTRHVLVPLAAALALALGAPSAAGAAKPPKPDQPLYATPSTACTILVQYGAGGYTSPRDCMANLRGDLQAFRYPSDADPEVLLTLWQRCAEFESQFLTYPFVFSEDEPGAPPWPFPTLSAHNRQQCAVTLFTYHALAETLGPPPTT